MAQAIEVNGRLELVCEWFARCMNSTLRATEHPILGTVPVCTRCAMRHGLKTVEIEVKR